MTDLLQVFVIRKKSVRCRRGFALKQVVQLAKFELDHTIDSMSDFAARAKKIAKKLKQTIASRPPKKPNRQPLERRSARTRGPRRRRRRRQGVAADASQQRPVCQPTRWLRRLTSYRPLILREPPPFRFGSAPDALKCISSCVTRWRLKDVHIDAPLILPARLDLRGGFFVFSPRFQGAYGRVSSLQLWTAVIG